MGAEDNSGGSLSIPIERPLSPWESRQSAARPAELDGAPQRWHQVHTAQPGSVQLPIASASEAQHNHVAGGAHPRLSPYLPSKPARFDACGAPSTLLGRPRSVKAEQLNSPGIGTVRRAVCAEVRDRPEGLAPIRTVGSPQGQFAAAGPSPSISPCAELAALSNLTVAGDSGTSVMTAGAALTDATAELGSAPSSVLPTPRSAAPTAEMPAPAPPAAAGAADWRSAFRVPLFTASGQLMGYRQNSRMMQSQLVSYDGLSPPISPGTAEGDPWQQLEHGSEAASREFAAAATDPLKGFPFPEDVVPGYLLGPVLGHGGFCTVRKALHLGTRLPAAVKIIEKTRLKDPKDRERVDREVRVMRQLAGHVAVVQLLESVETERYRYIVMEHCAGRSLLEHVRARRRLDECESAGLLQQLLHALQFCHRRGVVHRDIKLENVLLDGRGGVRLIDFGLCGYFVPGKPLRCHCGSPSYAAPEIVARREYLAPPVDVWSLGVVLFAMLAGYLPFHAKEKKELSQRIVAGVYTVPTWVSTAAADLVGRMLELDPQKRISLEEVWAHPWTAAAPRWEPPSGLQRGAVDSAGAAVGVDPELLEALRARGGVDVEAVVRALRARECSPVTVGYHLLGEARAQRQQAPGRPQPGRACSREDDADCDDGSRSGGSDSSRSSGTMMR